MRILQLNVWMGRVEGTLRRFLENNDFDVICMQEVMQSSDAEEHLSRLCLDASQIIKVSGMPYHYYSPNWGSKIAHGTYNWGNLILSKIPIIEKTNQFVNGKYISDTILGKSPANNLNVQIVKLENGITIANHHGFWRPQPMGDEESVRVFQNLAHIIKPAADNGPFILCGDLNLEHAAPAMHALDFLIDLTEENHIKNTLSGLKFNGKVACDHIMINDKIQATDFVVHPDLISDHLALSVDATARIETLTSAPIAS